MTKLKTALFFLSTFFLISPFSAFAVDESITITTYYPSPYGAYNELKTYSNTYLAISSGSVGIGTTSPSVKLEIRKPTNDPAILIYDLRSGRDLAAGNTNEIAFSHIYNTIKAAIGSVLSKPAADYNTNLYFSTQDYSLGYGERMRITSEGNVGIGTTGPTTKLYVQTAGTGGSIAASTANSAIRIKDTDGQAASKWGISWARADADYTIAAIEPEVASGWPTALKFFTNTDGATQITEKMRITSGGNVGIGTTSPEVMLDIPSHSATKNNVHFGSFGIQSTTNINGFLTNNGYWNGSNMIYRNDGSLAMFQFVNGDIRFRSAVSGLAGGIATLVDNLIVKNTGNLGIGTTGPNDKLHILGANAYPLRLERTSAGSVDIGFASTISGDSYDFKIAPVLVNSGVAIHSRNASGLVDALMINYNGNVGIGTINPGAQLDLSTDSARKLSTTTWSTGSDIRLKKEIRPFSDGLDVISRINPVWFKWNGKAAHPDDGKDNIGVIGQEIEKVAPYTITRTKAKLEPTDNDETELLDFTSHALTFVLINAVKEQQKEIEGLKAEIDKLKAKLSI